VSPGDVLLSIRVPIATAMVRLYLDCYERAAP